MTKSHYLRICSFLLLCISNLCMTSVKADVVEISSAGTLSTLLPETATEVTIKGPINGTDVKYLRHLINDKSLTSMDMTETRFVAGGEAYYNDYKATEDDVIGDYMFHECPNLKVLRLPTSITRIKDKAFTFAGISEIDIPNNVHSIGWDGFASCPSLTKAVIGRGITSLGHVEVFYNYELLRYTGCQTNEDAVRLYLNDNRAESLYSWLIANGINQQLARETTLSLKTILNDIDCSNGRSKSLVAIMPRQDKYILKNNTLNEIYS